MGALRVLLGTYLGSIFSISLCCGLLLLHYYHESILYMLVIDSFIIVSDVRNHPVLIHCKRGKVPINFIVNWIAICHISLSWFLGLSLAPHWMPSWLLQKAAELVPFVGVWGVSLLCCRQVTVVRHEIYWVLWCLLHEGLHAQAHLSLPWLSSEKQAPIVWGEITVVGQGHISLTWKCRHSRDEYKL